MSPIEDAPDKNPKLARELMQCVEGRLNELSAADEVYMIEDTIELAQRARALTTEDSSDRNIACLLLANSLYQCFNEREDDGLLEEMISLGREALAIPPERHLDRSLSCSNLANSLWTRYERTGDVGLLDEVIDLQREALDLRPARHPNRASSCGNLATSLWSRYKCTGNVGLLEEVIDLEREALDLHTAGNPERAISCSNLANSLTTRYKRTGDVGLLDEVINLEREALVLCPKGDPYRSLSCGNLAISLKTRYQRTGDVGLLDEAIELQREAMILCPKGHPYRSLSCGNLAVSLKKRYLITGDTSFLNEAIDLERAALDLRPAGHPHRSSFCENLATSLMMRYNRTDGVDSLEEAIILQREALYLCPTGHPDRSVCCGNLAKSLWARYERTTDVSHLDESFALLQECVTIAPVHGMWRDLHHLTRMHLQNTTSVYDVSRAIMYLSQSLEHDPDDPLGFVISLSSLLDSLWECNTEGKYIQLTTIYQRLVNLLPLLVHPALALQPQLQALKTCTRLGSDAFVNAALAGSCSVGFETLELAQGVIWSQRLHRRDPQLKDVPEHLASKLYNLLASSAMGLSARLDHEGGKSLTSRDILHVQSSQAHSVIREIQALPGLDRFMLGETFETLRTVVSNQPVVVLVGARGHYYALVMADRFDGGCMLISIDLSNEDLKSLSFTPGASRARRSDVIPQQTPEKGDRAGIKKTESASSKPLDGQLQTLWYKVVKPVLTHLDLEVSNRIHSTICMC
jgi:tetratricopeptide (TPR) repeat protein